MIAIKKRRDKGKSHTAIFILCCAFIFTSLIFVYGLSTGRISLKDEESTLYIPQAYLDNGDGYTYLSSPFTDVYI